jgi:hypothetical protein
VGRRRVFGSGGDGSRAVAVGREEGSTRSELMLRGRVALRGLVRCALVNCCCVSMDFRSRGCCFFFDVAESALHRLCIDQVGVGLELMGVALPRR